MNQTLISELSAIGVDVVHNADGRRFGTREGLAQVIGSAEYAVVGVEPVGEEVIAACPNLEIVAKYGVEPFDASAFEGDDRLYFTPHIGGNSRESVMAMGRSAIDHLRRHIERGPEP